MKKFYYLLIILSFSFFVNGQTILINPATDGGFENGATFAANGWTTVNHGTNDWYCGSSTAGSPLANWWTGSNGAYISNNGGTNWDYTGTTTQASHFYKDVTFPAGQTTITLAFDIRLLGVVGIDNLQVYIADTSVTPSNVGPTGSNTTTTGWPGYTNGTTGYHLYSNFNTVSSTATTSAYITFTVAQGAYCAGNTKRLIFTWKNNNAGVTQPPASIDNISLVSTTPPSNNECTSAVSLIVNPTEVCASSTSGTTVGANDGGLSGCVGTPDDDVWYSFVATSSAHTVSVTASTLQNSVVQFFQGTCVALSNIGCRNVNVVTGDEIFTLNGLTPGNTYFVRVYSFDYSLGSKGAFNICVTTPPTGCAVKAPDDIYAKCNESKTITASSTQVSYSMINSPCDPIAITGTNAFPVAADDAVTGQIPIGFDFNFYGNVYSTAVIQTNGILGFGNFTFTGYSSFAIPATTNPNNYIAGIFADIDIRYGGTITYATVGTAPNRQFVVSYNNVVPFGNFMAGTGTASFQIVLNENGSFNIIISQFSANWNAYTSGALATSGCENIDGTIAFPVPLRNATDWPGIVPGDRDCRTFITSACTFSRWQQGATVLTTNPVLNVSPTSTTTYTAVWNCGGSECSDDTIVTVLPSSVIKSNVIDNTNCVFPNGIINLSTDNLNEPSYTVSYLQNGTPASQTINLTSQNISPGDTFNSGVLTNTDPRWTRNNTGSVCNASAVPSQFFDVYSFTVTANGLYAFDMCNGASSFNGFASLYQNAFNLNNPCDISSNHIISDDNGNPNAGVCDNDARISAALSTGITYYLVTTSRDPNITGDYIWTFVSGPGNIVNNDSYYQLTNLSAGTYSNFSITTNCGNVTFPGPIVLGDSSQRTWLGTTNNDWNNPVNWSNGQIPTAFNCVVIPITANNPVISGVNYNAFAYSLTVLNGASLIVNPENSIIVTDVVNINAGGDLQLTNSSSLIQVNNNPNSGTMHMARTVSMRRLDYVYWSSPVTSFASSAISPLTPTSYIYKWAPSLGYTVNNHGSWLSGNENMVVGKGYIVRGPNTFTTTLAPFTATFTGTPNNGIITTPISRGVWNSGSYATGLSTTLATEHDDNWNLIGNPYPSAVNAISFLTANTNIDGFIKVWTHGTLPDVITPDHFYDDHVYNYSPGDYITYNSAGTSSGPGVFLGNIAAGQGFFVAMLHTSAGTNETVTFNNSMRGTSNSNSQFFRNANQAQTENDGRIWLDLINSSSNAVRNLVGYMEGASNNRDRLYDAFTDEKLDFNLYSKIGDEMMVIQGRTLPFDQEDRVSIGYKVPQDGTYSIGIGAVDGFFTNINQDIYLEDTVTNIIHDLRQSPYSFTTTAGNYPNRFVLRYTNETLGGDDFEADNANVWVYSSDVLSVKSTKNEIKAVRVFDILGRELANYPEVNSYELPLSKIQKNKAGLIIQITLTNGTIVNKKVIY